MKLTKQKLINLLDGELFLRDYKGIISANNNFFVVYNDYTLKISFNSSFNGCYIFVNGSIGSFNCECVYRLRQSIEETLKGSVNND